MARTCSKARGARGLKIHLHAQAAKLARIFKHFLSGDVPPSIGLDESVSDLQRPYLGHMHFGSLREPLQKSDQQKCSKTASFVYELTNCGDAHTLAFG